MNEYAFRHAQRLQFAARRLARDLQALRSDPMLPKLYRELHDSLQVRLTTVTAARRMFGQWWRAHPDASNREVRQVLGEMQIPVTRPGLRRAIREIKREVREKIRSVLPLE